MSSTMVASNQVLHHITTIPNAINSVGLNSKRKMKSLFLIDYHNLVRMRNSYNKLITFDIRDCTMRHGSTYRRNRKPQEFAQ